MTVNRDGITDEMIEKYAQDFSSNRYSKIIMNAIINNGINSVAMNSKSIIEMQYTFSEEIDTGKVTNQKQSGRCWLFAGLNTLRHKMAEEFNLSKDFELSQNYQMFWDKFEKSNYFFECVFDTIKENVDSRIVMWILSTPQQDGGQWDMFSNVVRKYGVVPKYVMPETFHSSQTAQMNWLLNAKLREDAALLRKLYRQGIAVEKLYEKKEDMLGEIYNILCYFLGEPPVKFDFEYKDEKKNYHRDINVTPIDFYNKYAGGSIDEYVSIINAPTSDKAFNKTYTVKYLGNVVGGKNVHYLNVDIDTLKSLVLAQLKDGESVWFGCDVGKYYDRTNGIMDTNLYHYNEVLNIPFEMSKAERLDYGESCLTHAMVLTGANIKDGKPNRWKVENSWGDEKGNKGFFVMSDSWFDEYTYQVVVNKKYLPEKLKKVIEQKPFELAPWDPMGALAIMK